ncbi:two-component sensor histidine kinase [Paenibacillus curdlanolyticus]|nr:two-component sensor histidine kinase [Paenibacillus curdlanolyticus]
MSYWTLRYFIILFTVLITLAVAVVWWTNRATMDSRQQTAERLAQEIARHLHSVNGTILIPPNMDEIIDRRVWLIENGAKLCVIITDKDGKLLYSNESITQADLSSRLNDKLNKSLVPGYRAVTAPILYNGGKIGQVALLHPVESLIQRPEFQWALILLLVSLATLGWLMIYLLARKLARPIRNVASAAREISLGRYDIELSANPKERELGELVISFKEMASKLKQLEHSRNFMLAGLTHELKTPVTSAKGLIHAVKEKVVQDDEADEFLDIALQETSRLERMITDLLDYNALAAGLVTVRRCRLDTAVLLPEIVYQWTLHQDEGVCEPVFSMPRQQVEVEGDPLRIQQIIVNLLNNSAQSKHPDRLLRITISVQEREDGYADILVCDNGTGIPPSEQPLVFERFFRGESKKQSVRGLGLGLAFSKLLAQAQQGDLILQESSENGTSFLLRLPSEIQFYVN